MPSQQIDESGLTEMQSRFIDEFMLDPIATRAAIRAGCSRANAKQQAYHWLQTPHVKAELDRRRKAREGRVQVTADGVLRELSLIAYADLADVFAELLRQNFDLDKLDPDLRRTISSLKVRRVAGAKKKGERIELIELKCWSKDKALELLSKHTKVIRERVEVTGKDGGPVETAQKITIYIPENGRDQPSLAVDSVAASEIPGDAQ